MRYFENEYQDHLLERKVKIMSSFIRNRLVLDVGCGEHVRLGKLIGRSCSYTGIDIETLPRNFDIGRLIKASLDEIITTGEKFDVVISNCVLEEVNDESEHIKLLREATKVGGHVIAAVPNAKSFNRRMGVVNGFIQHHYELDVNDIRQGHMRMFDFRTFSAAFMKHFEEAIIKPVGFKPLPMRDMPKIKEYWHQYDMMVEAGEINVDLCAELVAICQKKDA